MGGPSVVSGPDQEYGSAGDMTPEEKQNRIAAITLELERLQVEYATLLARRESLAAELQQLSQIRHRLKKLRSAAPYVNATEGAQFNAKT
jgi:hypothetical protein